MARFGQGMIYSLMNPNYSQQMGQMGMLAGSLPGRRRENRNQQEQFQNAMQGQQQFTRAAQSGDHRLASQSVDQMTQAAGALRNPALAQSAGQAQSQLQDIRSQGALKGILNIEKALSNPDISEEAASALSARREELLNNENTQRAYQEAQVQMREQTIKRMKEEADLAMKQESVRQVEENKRVNAATDAMIGGVPADKLSQAFAPGVLRKASEEAASYTKAVSEAQKYRAANTPLTGDEDAFDMLDPVVKAQVLREQVTRGPEAARDTLSKAMAASAKHSLESSRALAEQSANIDMQTLKSEYLMNRDSEWRMDKNVAEWYREQDDDTRKELDAEIEQLFDFGIGEAQRRRATGEEVDIRGAAVDFVNSHMARRAQLDLRPQKERERRRENEAALLEKLKAANPSWTTKQAQDHMDRLIQKQRFETRKGLTPSSM